VTIDVILYDCDGAYCPPNLSAPVGGSEVELYQLHEAFNRAGLSCKLITKRPGSAMGSISCRRLVFWRQVEVVPWCQHDAAPVIRATDAKEPNHRAPYGFTTICVSRWQASAFVTPTIVIPPMLGKHVQRNGPVVLDEDGNRFLDAWIYASAANKGLHETLEAWSHRCCGDLYVTTTGYDEPEAGLCERYGATWLGRLNPHDILKWMRSCRGMYYRNVAPETFGVTTAIAVKLGLELDIECVGHEACGLAESRVPQDLSEPTIIKQWLEALRL
jgi:hypothetical protein